MPRGILELNHERKLLSLFARYFEKIRYWQDEDSGHWEEARKIEASSIGVVVGALEEFQALARANGGGDWGCYGQTLTGPELEGLLNDLIRQGNESLADTAMGM